MAHRLMEDAIDAAAGRRALAAAGISTDPASDTVARARVIASVIGDSMVHVWGGAEHLEPSGGGPAAAIARAS